MQATCPIRYTPHADVMDAFGQAPVAIALYEGDDFRLRFFNARYSEILGKKPPLGQTIMEIIPELRGSEFEGYLHAALHRGETIAKDGKRLILKGAAGEAAKNLTFNFSYSPWRDELGRVRGVLIIVVDTSEQANANIKLEAADRRMRAMADALPHAVYICAPTGELRYVNNRWKQLTGSDEKSWTAELWQKLVHPEDLASVNACWIKAAGGDGAFDVYARLRFSGTDTYRWQRILGRSHMEMGPDDVIWVGTWTDVHDRMVTDAANKAAQKQFIATLTHDLRNPLAGIRASVDNMQRKTESDGPFAAKFKRILTTIDRADHMLESLLDIDRILSDTASGMSFEPIDLAELLRTCVAHHAATHGERFVAHIPPSIVGPWHGSSLTRAVDNLVGNAFKYGDPTSQVTLSVEHDEQNCTIRVHNEGNPIPAQEQERVFVPYARGSNTTSKGWGLGLSMVQGVAKVHRGSIDVTSDASCGTTFTLALPKARPEA